MKKVIIGLLVEDDIVRADISFLLERRSIKLLSYKEVPVD